MSSPFVMIMLVEAISVQKFCSADFIGQPFSKTLTLIMSRVSAVRS